VQGDEAEEVADAAVEVTAAATEAIIRLGLKPSEAI
jgi:hypothetical protein